MISDFFKASRRRHEESERQVRRQHEIERHVCALVARGNVSLQRGEYITKDDLDRAQAKLESFFFSDKSKW